MKAAVASATFALSLVLGGNALAQSYDATAVADVATGVESGGAGVRRARSRLRLGVELRVDERPSDAFIVACLVDVEPKSSVGFDLRYGRLVGPFLLTAGPIGYVAPQSLLGGAGAATARVSWSSHLALEVGPEVTAFALGTDLPDGSVLWQALLKGGLRVDL
jgi:hypothetical protein